MFILRLSLFLCCAVSIGHSYKPVVIIHGLLDELHSLDKLSGYIRKYHPGTNVTLVNLYHGWKSIIPMWTQVQTFGKVVEQVSSGTENPDGFHVIGYSQGGLVARGILSAMNHTVDTFISLSSPQMGQYGDTSYLKWLFPHNVRSNLYKIFYSKYGQQISIGNYWNDPHHQELYRNYSTYLAVLNNETYNPSSDLMKQNFLRLNRLVLIGGPDDGVITPWQSSHFGYYDGTEQIVEMKRQKVFKKDTFGLRTLYHRKDLVVYTVPGVEHLQWHSNETVFTDCILPWLT